MSELSIADYQARLASLERRWQRERNARKAAEQFISDKSRELYLAQENISSAMTILHLALSHAGEFIWQWTEHDRSFGSPLPASNLLRFPWSGHEADFVTRLHPEDADIFAEAWEHFVEGHRARFDLDLRFITDDNDWQIYRMRAAPVSTDEQGRVLQAAGILLEITAEDYRDPLEDGP